MLVTALLLVTTIVHATPLPASALDGFAAAWSRIDSYTATLVMHETQGVHVQDRTYAYTFGKPSNATITITAGPGRGGKVAWAGGNTVTGSPPGLLSGIKLRLPLHDARVTSLRGDTVEMASFGWLLDHFRSTRGATTQTTGPTVNGVLTSEVAVAVAAPASDDGITREVLFLSRATKLPLELDRYIGASIVKHVQYMNVVTMPPK